MFRKGSKSHQKIRLTCLLCDPLKKVYQMVNERQMLAMCRGPSVPEHVHFKNTRSVSRSLATLLALPGHYRIMNLVTNRSRCHYRS